MSEVEELRKEIVNIKAEIKKIKGLNQKNIESIFLILICHNYRYNI